MYHEHIMPKSRPSLSLSAFIVSLREFARNADIRRKALKQKRPVIVEQSREQSFFVLLPPSLYEDLFELYRDMRDSHDLKQAMQEETEWHDWEDVQKELST